MSTFPGSPRLTKGAIVSFDIWNPIPQVIKFQYNPDTMTRTLTGKGAGGEGAKSEPFRLSGPPEEEVSIDVEFDATDQLEHPEQNPTSTSLGIYPQLAALEMILYPKSTRIVANTALLMSGAMEIIPPEGPFTLFIWGHQRILPVQITKYNITEEAHDTNLNPIRAKVSLSMKVLTYADLEHTHPGYALYLTHQVTKEFMATKANINSLSGLTGGSTIF